MTMTAEIFISVLVISATATSLGIEIVKNLLNKLQYEYSVMPLSVAIAFVIGLVEMAIYTSVNGAFTPMTCLYGICMGFANVLGATTSYDTVKKFILTLMGK